MNYLLSSIRGQRGGGLVWGKVKEASGSLVVKVLKCCAGELDLVLRVTRRPWAGGMIVAQLE